MRKLSIREESVWTYFTCGALFDFIGKFSCRRTSEKHYEAWKSLAEELGITGFTKEDNRRQRGVSRMASLEVVLEKSDKLYSMKNGKTVLQYLLIVTLAIMSVGAFLGIKEELAKKEVKDAMAQSRVVLYEGPSVMYMTQMSIIRDSR